MTATRRKISDEPPMRRLLDALPGAVERLFHRLQRPGAIWLRVPLGVLLIVGGCLGFLPVLGFWMVPLGALLLAEDIPFLRRPTLAALAAVQHGWDRFRAWRRR